MSTVAYSATTPASRRAISAMRASGKDRSRPVRRPTFFVIVSTDYHVPEVAFQNLPRRIARHALQEHEIPRHLGPGEPRLAVRRELLHRRVAPGALDHERAHPLS